MNEHSVLVIGGGVAGLGSFCQGGSFMHAFQSCFIRVPKKVNRA